MSQNGKNFPPLPPRVDGDASGDGRGVRGRFAPGNKLGRGNPLAGRAAKIRAVLLKAVTPAVARKIAAKLIEQAEAGDMAAIKELLNRTVGTPASTDLIERIEAIEQQLGQQRMR